MSADRLLIHGRSSETKKDRATRGKMLQHAIPFPAVGPMAFIEDHQAEVVCGILTIFIPGSQMRNSCHEYVQRTNPLYRGARAGVFGPG